MGPKKSKKIEVENDVFLRCVFDIDLSRFLFDAGLQKSTFFGSISAILTAILATYCMPFTSEFQACGSISPSTFNGVIPSVAMNNLALELDVSIKVCDHVSNPSPFTKIISAFATDLASAALGI